MKFIHTINALFFLLLVAPISNAQPITIYGGDIPGLHTADNNKAKEPILLALDKLMKEAGIEYELLLMNLAQANRQFRRDRGSLYLSMTRMGENKERFQWIFPWATLDFKVAKLKNRVIGIPATFNGLKRYKFGVLRESSTEFILVKHGFIEETHYIAVSSSLMLVKLMDESLIDYVFYEPTISPQIIAETGFSPDILEVTDIEVPYKVRIWLAGTEYLDRDVATKLKQTHLKLMKEDSTYLEYVKRIL